MQSSDEKKSDNYIKFSNWIKVAYLKPGMDIAVYDPENNEAVWERISEIRLHESQHVYDLMIENTHNFIANDIIAHNTYMGGYVGIGTTRPTEKLIVIGNANISGYVNASDFYRGINKLIDEGYSLFNRGNFSAEYTLIGYNRANFTNDYTNFGGYKKENLTTDYPNLDTDISDDYNCGNFSADYTLSGFKLENITGKATNLTTLNVTGQTLLAVGSGNVGIGTTSPNFKLDINGNINATDLYINATYYNGTSPTPKQYFNGTCMRIDVGTSYLAICP